MIFIFKYLDNYERNRIKEKLKYFKTMNIIKKKIESKKKDCSIDYIKDLYSEYNIDKYKEEIQVKLLGRNSLTFLENFLKKINPNKKYLDTNYDVVNKFIENKNYNKDIVVRLIGYEYLTDEEEEELEAQDYYYERECPINLFHNLLDHLAQINSLECYTIGYSDLLDNYNLVKHLGEKDIKGILDYMYSDYDFNKLNDEEIQKLIQQNIEMDCPEPVVFCFINKKIEDIDICNIVDSGTYYNYESICIYNIENGCVFETREDPFGEGFKYKSLSSILHYFECEHNDEYDKNYMSTIEAFDRYRKGKDW